MDELIVATAKLLIEEGMVRPGDKLVILTGAPIVERGHTNLMKLYRVGSP